MKHLIGLILCCLLLTGCGKSEPAATIPTTEAPETVPPTEPVALYQPGSPMETETQGAVRSYPLPMADAYGLRAMGHQLVLFSGSPTRLSLLSGEELYILNALDLGFDLETDDPSLQVGEQGLSYFDPTSYETVVLDSALREIRRIAAPLDMEGGPILSGDGKTLYYCTAGSLRAWDLESGVRRLVKEMAFPGQHLTGLHLDGTVLQCTIPDENRTMLLSSQDGRLLWEGEAGFTMTTREGRCYAAIPTGMRRDLVFGDNQVLVPRNLTEGQFLETIQGAVTVDFGEDGRQELSFYDLATGLRSSVLPLDAGEAPQVEDMGSFVFVLCDGLLYRWDVRSLPSGDRTVYTGDWGETWLEECQAYADDIAARYGIPLLIGQAAAEAQPWDYEFEPENLTVSTWRQLELLDACLSRFPRSLLDEAIAPFGGLRICLVRKITGAPESGSVETAHGVQFREETGATIALAVGPASQRTLYHELFHIMETRLLSESTAFDQWENLNPKGFAYDMRYGAPHEPGAYLDGEGRAFIDSYSMSFPKEDRARVMEYAMTPGQAELFRAPILQAKLEALCSGLRDAFGLKKSPETFLWEQYLDKPLASAN